MAPDGCDGQYHCGRPGLPGRPGPTAGPLFRPLASRDRVLAYLRGLLSEAERKNSWQVAEVCGESTPYGFQYLLSRADWDADAVRDELYTYSMQHLGDTHGVLVLDETGFLKKGRHSAGVARQYTGTVGKVDNCQIGVFLSYASRLGHALLDRELYLPQAWTDDRERCRQAGIPEGRRFATKRSWPSRCWPAPSQLACWPPGSRGTACTGIIAHCGGGWKPNRRPTSWRSRARNMWGSTRSSAR